MLTYHLPRTAVDNIGTTTICYGQHPNYHNLLWTITQLPQFAMDDVPTTIIWYWQYLKYHRLLWTTSQLERTTSDNFQSTTNYYEQHPIYHKSLWTTSQLPQTTMDNFPATTNCHRFACSIEYSSSEVHNIGNECRRISKLVTTQTGSLKARKREQQITYINVCHRRTLQSTYFDFFISSSNKNTTRIISLLSIYFSTQSTPHLRHLSCRGNSISIPCCQSMCCVTIWRVNATSTLWPDPTGPDRPS